MHAIWVQKDTEELLAVWKKNDRVSWSDNTFEVVRQILIERTGSVPPQADSNNNLDIPNSNYLIRFGPAISARRKPIVLLLSAIGILLLANYILTAIVWNSSECRIPLNTLGIRVSVEQVESEYMDNSVPFGDRHSEWAALKAKMTFLDQLRSYDDIGFLSGTAGYAIVRFGVPIACIAIMYS
jgi:hypothetical protein